MNAPVPELNWLEDPQVFAVNRLDAHSDHVWYADGSDLRQSLDGPWRFAYSPCPAQRPAAFWQEGADLTGFAEIAVPGHIELQGYGQIQYINTMYPWDGCHSLRPPRIAWDDTPVGSYVKTFRLDEALQGKRVCVSFQGVERAFYCWCNGQFVGYSEDSFTPADFDLTAYLRPGENRLCVEVYKNCSGSWLEDQDFFRFFGIFRPVYLYAKPSVHIEDLWLRAGLETDNTTGTLAPRLRLSAAEGASVEGCGLHCTVTAPGGRVIWDAPIPLDKGGDGCWYGAPVRLPDIRKWDHEDPALYEVTLTLRDAGGAVQETVPYKTGFRRFGMDQGVMKLNGERIVFNGVNRHEWNPETGRAIGPEDMYRAMETFRRNNINAVRTCHYPDQTLWYHLCDENGIYMIDETNLESHGSWQKMGRVDPAWNVPGSLPEWRDCVVDRARSMFERDKNHTAILIWSCGNESYAGEDILAMSDFFHRNDPGRLVHYEGVFHCRAFDQISDMESRMYAKPDEIRAYLDAKPAKPFILCEYMHDMGNSLGGMESYIRLAREYPQYQGGFVWDYMDQALWQPGVQGRRLGYGGDFGERPTDYAFSANGIVFADGTEKPAMQDLRYWYDTPRPSGCLGRGECPPGCGLYAASPAGRRPPDRGGRGRQPGGPGRGLCPAILLHRGGAGLPAERGYRVDLACAPPGPVARPHRERPGLRLPGGQRRLDGGRRLPQAGGLDHRQGAGRQRADHLYLPLPHGAGGLGGSQLYRHRQRPAGGCPLPWDRKRARTAVVRGALCHGAARRPGELDRPVRGDLPRPV